MKKIVRAVRAKTRMIRNGGLSEENENQVGLLPKVGWRRRNIRFIGQRIIPGIFTRRTGAFQSPEFPELKEDEVALTWIGHATFLLQMGASNILIDPNWAMWHAMVKRARVPGLRLGDLPRIDLVLISHAHYDHLHMKSLRSVADGQTVMVPKGVGALLRRRRFGEVHEMDYWESRAHGEIEIVFTPTQHWGARFIHDTHRGFGGFLIRHGSRTVFHCGDSAFFDGFTEIGSRFPGIDVALMPIGAYDAPSGREVHMNPEEALSAFEHLSAGTMVPMHYGTFPLGSEPMHEPLERLRIAASRRGLTERVHVLEEGLPRVF